MTRRRLNMVMKEDAGWQLGSRYQGSQSLVESKPRGFQRRWIKKKRVELSGSGVEQQQQQQKSWTNSNVFDYVWEKSNGIRQYLKVNQS